ncbi:MAG: hypothetical protein QXX77_04585 [Candidatus Methanosuratincola sp.]
MSGVIWTVMSFVVAAIGIMVGVLVFYNVQLALPTTSLSTAAQTVISNVASTAGSGFALLTVSLIVIAASVILGILLRGLGGTAE